MPDSRVATLEHIGHVTDRIIEIIDKLVIRSNEHDKSKLGPIEKPYFDILQDMSDIEFGSEAYGKMLMSATPGIEHHYSVNDHHPEYYENGIRGMSLLAMLEMLADWKAASIRNKDPDFRHSMFVCKERFHIPDALFNALDKTVSELGWYD